MISAILAALKNMPSLKTVGSIEVLESLTTQPLQAHQLPAAILMPEVATAQANTFFGGQIQQMDLRYEIWLLMAFNAASRAMITDTSSNLSTIIAKALAGITADNQTLDFQAIEPVDLVSSLQTGQLMQKIVFKASEYIHKN